MEHAQVTIVFTDLAGSTQVKSNLPGDDLSQRNRCFFEQILVPHRRRVVDTAKDLGGRIVKVMGDGFFLVFDDPTTAVRWIADLQVSHLTDPIPTPVGDLGVKVGVHIGSPLTDGNDYIGQEVDFAARLSDLAGAQQVLLSQEMIDAVGRSIGAMTVHPHGPQVLKGLGALPVYELLYPGRQPGAIKTAGTKSEGLDRSWGELEVMTGPDQAFRVPLLNDRMTIGRERSCAVFIDQRSVSRRHAELVRDPYGRWSIRDLNSSNGTYVNKRRLDSNEDCLLNGYEDIRVGRVRLRIVPPSQVKVDDEQMANAMEFDMTMDDAMPATINSYQGNDLTRLDTRYLSDLLAFGDRLMATESARERMRQLCQWLVRPEVAANAAMVLRLSSADPTRPAKVVEQAQATGMAGQEPYVSGSVLRKAIETDSPVLAGNVGGGSFDVSMSISSDVMAMSAVACPLSREGTTVDLLYVALPPELGTPQWMSLARAAVRFYEQSVSAWQVSEAAQDHAVAERDSERAVEIMRRLVNTSPQVPGLDLALRYEPCRWVSGDFVDVVRHEASGRVVLAVADIEARGMEAAVTASSLHAILHTGTQAGTKLALIMETINTYLCQNLAEDSCVSMVCMMLDPASGKFIFANAGHLPAMLVRGPGQVVELGGREDMALGVLPGSVVCGRGVLEADQWLVFCTDGISEQIDTEGQMYGRQRLARGLGKQKSTPGLTATAVADGVFDRLTNYAGPRTPADDRTVLVAQLVRS